MIVEFVDGTCATIIIFISKQGEQQHRTISNISDYVWGIGDSTHIAVAQQINSSEITRIYPIDKVLCIHKDQSTLRQRKIDSILDNE